MRCRKINQAIDNMITLYKSYVQIGDVSIIALFFINGTNIYVFIIQTSKCVALYCFNDSTRKLINLQQIKDQIHLDNLLPQFNNARNITRGGTRMYRSLARVIRRLSHSESNLETWIICLTDGISQDNRFVIKHDLVRSPENLHIILVGVSLPEKYQTDMINLCCKYGQRSTKGFFVPTTADIHAFRNKFQIMASRIPVSKTFEHDGCLTDDECRKLLDRNIPKFIRHNNMILRRFWVLFIYRRIKIFDENEEFNYNEKYDNLGSTLMKVMMNEA